MRIGMAIIIFLVFSSTIVLAQEAVTIREAKILGQVIKVGQGADIVQSRIRADRFETSGYSYGDVSKGYYNDKGITYIVTYGPPKGGTGGYIVQQIEKVKSPNTTSAAPPASSSAVEKSPLSYTREQVIETQRTFKVRVISFDATQELGTQFPYSDFVRLKITNTSKIVLDTLTVLTKRFDSNGRMIGASRAPSIPVHDLKPGQSAEFDYYPRGHLPRVKKITVEVEQLISKQDEQFITELPK